MIALQIFIGMSIMGFIVGLGGMMWAILKLKTKLKGEIE